MWVLKGRLVPMSAHAVAGATEESAFSGRVWIGDDGRIAAITRGTAAGPPEFHGATQVDVGTSLVMPGMIDMHNHLAYNTLPLWTEPSQQTPFKHHDSWTRADTYSASTTWPAYALITACPEELLAYVETKSIVGGTTTVQGSPPQNRPRDGWLVRNVEDESFGTGDRNRVYASTLTAKAPVLADRANNMRRGSTFIYHCAEGQLGSLVAREWADAAHAGCLQSSFVAVHANAVNPSVFAGWSTPGGIAWSPLSNLWLYGQTTDVPAARAAGVRVCIGSDWAPSGTKHVLGELKVARLVADERGWDLTDADLVRMVTSNPGDLLTFSWGRQVGRLERGAIADLVVVHAKRGVAPFRRIVQATESDIDLVVIDGRPRYGVASLMSAAGADHVTPVKVGGEQRQLSLTRSDDAATGWAWDDVVARMDEVRADPVGEIHAAQALASAWAGRMDRPGAPLRLALDMPTGLAPVGGLPKDLTQVVVPPLQSLTHDQDWLDSLTGRGFHGGLLDGLAAYYN
jgi:5-methylthioadenosine/S-adenosylhomocysteine deaminase